MPDSLLHTKNYEAPPLDRREMLRYAGARELTQEQEALLDECLAELLPLLSYKVCWRFFSVELRDGMIDLEFAKCKSASLAANLSGCRQILLFAATVGIGTDRLVAKYGRVSPVKALFCQAIGAERIEALCNAFCAGIEQETGSLQPRFSPGYGDLSLELQTEIFQVLDCPRRIGLTLTESLLMSPTKSVTAIAGLKTSQAHTQNK